MTQPNKAASEMLAVRPLTSINTEAEAKTLATRLIAAGPEFLPKGIRTPQAALAVIMRAQELGLSTMRAISGMYIVDQKVGMSYDLLLEVLGNRGYEWGFLKRTDKKAHVMLRRSKRHPWGLDEFVHECEHCPKPHAGHCEVWTIEDAKRAKLAGKDNWQKYPKAMLSARAISAAGKAYAPDALGGCYSREELRELVPEAQYSELQAEVAADNPEEFRGAYEEHQDRKETDRSWVNQTAKPFLMELRDSAINETDEGVLAGLRDVEFPEWYAENIHRLHALVGSGRQTAHEWVRKCLQAMQVEKPKAYLARLKAKAEDDNVLYWCLLQAQECNAARQAAHSAMEVGNAELEEECTAMLFDWVGRYARRLIDAPDGEEKAKLARELEGWAEALHRPLEQLINEALEAESDD